MHYNRESYKFMSYIWRESYSELLFKFIFFFFLHLKYIINTTVISCLVLVYRISSSRHLHSILLFYSSSAYWNATRAFMILSAMTCFAGIIAGILSFAHFSAFERFNRSFAAGIMFFVSSKSLMQKTINILTFM